MTTNALFYAQDEDEIDKRRRTQLEPEKELMLAVLADAVDVATKPPLKGTRGNIERTYRAACIRNRQQARAWLKDNDDSWPFSFVAICDALGFSPSAIRKRLKLQRRGYS